MVQEIQGLWKEIINIIKLKKVSIFLKEPRFKQGWE